jgi:Holliday junction resolvase RusA-like endonuclease
MITLTLPYPPSANKRLAVVNGRLIKTAAHRAYVEEAGWIARNAVSTPLEGRVAVSVDIYRPRKVGDVDNGIKIVLDSLTGITWFDDEQVVTLHVERYDDKKCPRLEVRIEEK